MCKDNSMKQFRLLLDVCLILLEKSRFQNEANEIENAILEECERSIFDIDFENMFNRFKVDYTGFFRIFNKQYRDDINLIEEHIKKHPERSLGIIAFSESQQSTIEDALQEFRKTHRQYDSFFAEDKEEAFFIKNLENVQGDERDTIIFSICYGKNSQGRMYMRFGPLGHQGGKDV